MPYIDATIDESRRKDPRFSGQASVTSAVSANVVLFIIFSMQKYELCMLFDGNGLLKWLKGHARPVSNERPQPFSFVLHILILNRAQLDEGFVSCVHLSNYVFILY